MKRSALPLLATAHGGHRLPAGGPLGIALMLLLASAAPVAAGDWTADGAAGLQLVRVLTLQDYNTRVVVIGVSLLGLAAGLIGCFMLLRERALLGDALSHATLPGIGVAFILMTVLGGSGKSLAGLLIGGTISGVLGVATILLVVHLTRIKEDAALGIVLSVFFGLGIAVLGLIQNLGAGHAAGLKSFIYGKTASMVLSDAVTIAAAAALITLACLLLYKELTLLCFDPGFARAQGWPVLTLDVVLMALVVGVTVIGLQAVGLILMVALLVIPPAAARFWTQHLPTTLLVSALIGAGSGLVGATLSALVPKLPAGAIIVVVAGGFFIVSLVFGPARGVLRRAMEHRRLTRTVAHQHLLRAVYELSETHGVAGDARPDPTTGPEPRRRVAEVQHAATFDQLLRHRSWSPRQLRRTLHAAAKAGLLTAAPGGAAYALTPAGVRAAWRIARNHRLWELYLITHADIAPSHVDRDADEVEHVLAPALMERLEALLSEQYPDLAAPSSPHQLQPAGHAAGVTGGT